MWFCGDGVHPHVGAGRRHGIETSVELRLLVGIGGACAVEAGSGDTIARSREDVLEAMGLRPRFVGGIGRRLEEGLEILCFFREEIENCLLCRVRANTSKRGFHLVPKLGAECSRRASDTVAHNILFCRVFDRRRQSADERDVRCGLHRRQAEPAHTERKRHLRLGVGPCQGRCGAFPADLQFRQRGQFNV